MYIFIFCGKVLTPVIESEENAIGSRDTAGTTWSVAVKGIKLYADPKNVFWRFNIQVEMQETETHWEYQIPGLQFTSGTKTDKQSFFVPAVFESMKLMFYSCNGFSVGTNEDAWSGPALWNDVLRVHKETPLHVMYVLLINTSCGYPVFIGDFVITYANGRRIGGGDQIYNDGVRVNGPLRHWSDIKNPKTRRDYPFPESLRKDCDEYYASNYIKW